MFLSLAVASDVNQVRVKVDSASRGFFLYSKSRCP